ADVAYTDFTYTMVIRDVGEGRLVTFNYKGNDDYYVGVATGSVTVTKASMKVKVPFFKSIYCDEDLPADYVTVTPADKKIDVYTVFAGINSSANIGLYVNLPTSVTNVLYNDTVGKIWAALDKDGYTLKERLAEGMTVADFKKVLNNEAILKALELAGVDTTAFEALLAILNNNVIAGLTDGSRIAIGTPNRAGSYAVIAIGSNKNYETAQGYGTLLVRKRWGATLQWKNGDPTQGAEVLYNGKVGHVQDGIKVIYSGFTSDNKPYVSSKVPTEPGKYLANAFLLGGNYVALPIFQSFTIS
ncbi:MAG TPA: hypothetical protein PLS28_05750, partial [Clostridiales bacterium]|nr:hypothetical protein [Clostridiales bacterium]